MVLLASKMSPASTVGGWYTAMGQYSSLSEGAAVVSLDAFDIGEEVLVRVQVECERGEVNNGEKQERDRTRTNNKRSSTHHGLHEDGMSARYTDTLGGSS